VKTESLTRLAHVRSSCPAVQFTVSHTRRSTLTTCSSSTRLVVVVTAQQQSNSACIADSAPAPLARRTSSGLTPRIPRTVYRYFWAYPLLLFSLAVLYFLRAVDQSDSCRLFWSHVKIASLFVSYRLRCDTTWHDTIRYAILTCVRKLTQVRLIYRTEPTTKKREKVKKVKTDKLRSSSSSSSNFLYFFRSISKQSGDQWSRGVRRHLWQDATSIK